MRDDWAGVSATERNGNAPATSWMTSRGRCEPESVTRLLLAYVASVAAQLPAVLPALPFVAGEVVAVVREIARVASQLVPTGDDRGGVARGARAGDGVTVVRDLLPVADDLAPILAHLVVVGLELPTVVAHLGPRMRGLGGQRGGRDEGRGGAEEQ